MLITLGIFWHMIPLGDKAAQIYVMEQTTRNCYSIMTYLHLCMSQVHLNDQLCKQAILYSSTDHHHNENYGNNRS